MSSRNIFHPFGEVNCLFKYSRVVELRLISRPDSTPRTDFLCSPNGAREEGEKHTHLQSGTNRIIQEMAAVCMGTAKIRLLQKSQWAAVTVFCAVGETRHRGRQLQTLFVLPRGDMELPSSESSSHSQQTLGTVVQQWVFCIHS